MKWEWGASCSLPIFPLLFVSEMCVRAIMSPGRYSWQPYAPGTPEGQHSIGVFSMWKSERWWGARLHRHLDAGVRIQSGCDRELDRKIVRINNGGGALIYNTANQIVKKWSSRAAAVPHAPTTEARDLSQVKQFLPKLWNHLQSEGKLKTIHNITWGSLTDEPLGIARWCKQRFTLTQGQVKVTSSPNVCIWETAGNIPWTLGDWNPHPACSQHCISSPGPDLPCIHGW